MAALIEKLLAPARWLSGSYIRAWRNRAADTPFAVVLCYHRVTGGDDGNLLNVERGLPAEIFERQIRFMLRFFEPMRPSEVLRGSGSTMRFAVTFDDGTEDNYSVAAPILERLGLSAAFYVVQDFVGTDRRFWWEELSAILRSSKRSALNLDDCLDEDWRKHTAPRTPVLPLSSPAALSRAHNDLCAILCRLPHARLDTMLDRIAHALFVARVREGRDFPLMGWSELRDLNKRGFEIGCHTATHCNLGSADAPEIDVEVVEATRAIEAKIDSPVRSFAFPYGGQRHFNPAAADAMRRGTNIEVAFSTGPGAVSGKGDPYNQPRLALNRAHPVVWAHNLNQAVRAMTG
jgi:peptidoglycan/xylan/chitin deacetylase (PgdA/CDA1 family)